jgi:hypothetical protein
MPLRPIYLSRLARRRRAETLMTMEINTRAYLLFHLADQFETTRVPQFRPKQHRRYSKVLELDLHMMQVEVLGKSIEISVFQKSKTVWVAQGVYVGKPYQAQGRTEQRVHGCVRWSIKTLALLISVMPSIKVLRRNFIRLGMAVAVVGDVGPLIDCNIR